LVHINCVAVNRLVQEKGRL